jgi:hypothetical protein
LICPEEHKIIIIIIIISIGSWLEEGTQHSLAK